MTIEEAIGIMQRDKHRKFEGDPRNLAAARQLGIEALKRLQDRRTTQSFHPDDLLPGETKE